MLYLSYSCIYFSDVLWRHLSRARGSVGQYNYINVCRNNIFSFSQCFLPRIVCTHFRKISFRESTRPKFLRQNESRSRPGPWYKRYFCESGLPKQRSGSSSRNKLTDNTELVTSRQAKLNKKTLVQFLGRSVLNVSESGRFPDVPNRVCRSGTNGQSISAPVRWASFPVWWCVWGCLISSRFSSSGPYGRYSRAGWGVPVPARLAWFLQELPSFDRCATVNLAGTLYMTTSIIYPHKTRRWLAVSCCIISKGK